MSADIYMQRVECLAHRAHHYDPGTSRTQTFSPHRSFWKALKVGIQTFYFEGDGLHDAFVGESCL